MNYNSVSVKTEIIVFCGFISHRCMNVCVGECEAFVKQFVYHNGFRQMQSINRLPYMGFVDNL